MTYGNQTQQGPAIAQKAVKAASPGKTAPLACPKPASRPNRLQGGSRRSGLQSRRSRAPYRRSRPLERSLRSQRGNTRPSLGTGGLGKDARGLAVLLIALACAVAACGGFIRLILGLTAL